MKKENSPEISVESKQSRDQPLVRSRAASPMFAAHGFSGFNQPIHDKLTRADFPIRMPWMQKPNPVFLLISGSICT